MSPKLASLLGVLGSVLCLGLAAAIYPGGFDWGRDYISTLLRGPFGPSRILADAGVLVFCVSIAFAFERLARAAEFARTSKVIRIGGIGSQVYAGLTITPMHDLMVSISFLFVTVTVLAMTRTLWVKREMGFFAAGCVCLAVLVASGVVYYSGHFTSALPWGQRACIAVFAVWMLCLDHAFPRPDASC